MSRRRRRPAATPPSGRPGRRRGRPWASPAPVSGDRSPSGSARRRRAGRIGAPGCAGGAPTPATGPAGAPPSGGRAAPGAGSMPSSSSRTSRTSRRTWSASACRPARVRARARRPQSRSRSGYSAGQRLEVRGHRRVLAEGEPSDGPVLQGDQPQLLEAGPLGHGLGGLAQLGVRRPAPQRERLVQRRRAGARGRRRRGRAARARDSSCTPPVLLVDQPLEPLGVQSTPGRGAGRSRAPRSPAPSPAPGAGAPARAPAAGR